MVNNKQILIISSMLTDDPDVFLEHCGVHCQKCGKKCPDEDGSIEAGICPDCKEEAITEKKKKKKASKKKKKGWPKKLKKGRFTKYCKRHGFDGPCKACAKKAMKSKDASVRGMASFYMNTTQKNPKTKD